MSITLEAVKAEQTKLASMIAALEAQTKLQAAYPITVDLPPLNEGERYVGAILEAGGKRRHIFLLPGDNDAGYWQEQVNWAASIGGELPDRVVQALLFATMPEEFKKAAYWSSQSHAEDASSAWFQNFYDGRQDITRKSVALRARAVRSFAL